MFPRPPTKAACKALRRKVLRAVGAKSPAHLNRVVLGQACQTSGLAGEDFNRLRTAFDAIQDLHHALAEPTLTGRGQWMRHAARSARRLGIEA